MMPTKAVVLLSGGVDSTVALALAKENVKEVRALFVYYGQRQLMLEEHAVEALAKYYEVVMEYVSLPPFLLTPLGPKRVIPFRNGMFLSLAVALADRLDYQEVWSGIYSHPDMGFEYPDTTPLFTMSFDDAAQEGTGGRVRCVFPLQGHTKARALQWAKNLSVPVELTWTCYEPLGPPLLDGWRACGECPACVKLAKYQKEVDYVFSQQGISLLGCS